MLRLIGETTGPGMVGFIVILLGMALFGPVSAWGAEPTFMTLSVCAADPLNPERKVCQTGLLPKSYPDRALCERAVDLDGDGLPDQVWLDIVPRLTTPGQWVEIQCPPYKIPGA